VNSLRFDHLREDAVECWPYSDREEFGPSGRVRKATSEGARVDRKLSQDLRVTGDSSNAASKPTSIFLNSFAVFDPGVEARVRLPDRFT
jgi:hypothetical protein